MSGKKVLYITGACLTNNTSANISHNAFIQGLIENGCQIDIVMADESWGEKDASLPRWEQANYYTYHSVTVKDRLRKKAGRALLPATQAQQTGKKLENEKQNYRTKLRELLKRLYYLAFPADPLYPLNREWLKRAMTFKSDTEYDLVISNSSPAASHKLAGNLIQRGHVRCKRWVQIWEDPWYYDLYSSRSELVRQEEHKLLKETDEVLYVSTLTLRYQRQAFPDCANKMRHIPLPAFANDLQEKEETPKWDYGYFGDYYSVTRNLKPFYEALIRSGLKGIICGDSDCVPPSTDRISISGRITLDKLKGIQKRTKVLVHLSNLRGGQIPGKIYHYSATDKPILFILDGTEEEKEELKQYFEQYGRFYFCENNVASIIAVMDKINHDKREWKPVNAFLPQQVVSRLGV